MELQVLKIDYLRGRPFVEVLLGGDEKVKLYVDDSLSFWPTIYEEVEYEINRDEVKIGE